MEQPGTPLLARLVAYAPDGAVIGALPQPMQWQMAAPMNDIPSLQLMYSRDGSGADMLESPCEIAVELSTTTAVPGFPDTNYQEFNSCRFLNIKRSWDALSTDRVVTYTMPGYGWMLRKVRFGDATKINDKGRIPFTNASVGTILKALLDESQGRGNIPHMTWTFNGIFDSAGRPWPNTFTIEFEPGMDAWSILDAMARQGLCDWRFDKRELQLYVADTVMKRNIVTAQAYNVDPWSSATEAPVETSYEDMAATLIVVGDNKHTILMDNPTTPRPWGKWEDMQRAGGVTNDAAMRLMAQRILDIRSQQRTQMTMHFYRRVGSETPFVALLPGDLVTGWNQITSNPQDQLRVYQITLKMDADGQLQWDYVLNDRFMDRIMKYERWLNTLTGLGGPGPTGSGGTGIAPNDPPPPADDVVGPSPSYPPNLHVSAASYLDSQGHPVGLVSAGYDESTFPPDPAGTWTVDHYQLLWRPDAANPAGSGGGMSTSSGTTAYADALVSGTKYWFSALAVSNTGQMSGPSPEVAVTIPLMTVPPPQPTAPILSTKLGTVRVTWDGNAVVSGLPVPMPADFASVGVEVGTDGLSFTQVGEIYEPNSSVIVNYPLGTHVYARLRARNSSNLTSVVSAVSNIITQGVVGPDLEANSVTANAIAAGSITAEKIQAYSLSADRLTVGGATNLVADPNIVNVSLWSQRVSSALDNSIASLLWSASPANGPLITCVSQSAITTQVEACFPLQNNALLHPLNVSDGTPAPLDPGMLSQVTKPYGHPAGAMMARVQYLVSQPNAATWPVGAKVSVRLWIALYDRSGHLVTRLGCAAVDVTTPSTTTVMQLLEATSATAAQLPDGVVGFIPYLDVQAQNVPAGMTVTFQQPEYWQEGSVYIGDGMIKAPYIAADAITTRELDADAITVKHTITGALFQTSDPSTNLRVAISPTVVYDPLTGKSWPGMVIDGEDAQTTYGHATWIFMSDSAGQLGYPHGAFIILGPEDQRHQSGAGELIFSPDSSWSVGKSLTLQPLGTYMASVGGSATTNELILIGAMPVNHYDYACFRGYEKWFPGTTSITVTYPVDNGSFYKGQVSASNGSGGATTTPLYGALTNIGSASCTVTFSGTPNRVNLFLYRGDLMI